MTKQITIGDSLFAVSDNVKNIHIWKSKPEFEGQIVQMDIYKIRGNKAIFQKTEPHTVTLMELIDYEAGWWQ